MNVGIGRAIRFSYKAGSDVAGKAAVFLVMLLAARALPVATFGTFSLAATLGWILAVATDFGLQIHLAREVARTPERLRAILPPILRLRLWLAAAAIAATIPVALARLQGRDAFAFELIVVSYLASSLVEFLNYLYRAVERSEVESTLNLVQRLAVLALAFVLLRAAPSLTSLALALAVPPIAIFGWSLRLAKTLPGGAAEAPRSGPMPPGAFARDVLPIGLGIVFSALYFRLDVFLVEYWRGVEDVARYNAVFRLIEALRLFPAAALTVLLPSVFRRRDADFSRRLSLGLAGAGALLAGTAWPAAPQILTVTYGSQYLVALPAFRVLLLAFPLLSLNYGLTHQIIGWGEQKKYALACGLAIAVNVLLNAALIPSMGITGAAWATLGTEAFLTIAWIATLRSISVSSRPRD